LLKLLKRMYFEAVLFYTSAYHQETLEGGIYCG
jgi:hypothetical protein